jgi:hypothetical protein
MSVRARSAHLGRGAAIALAMQLGACAAPAPPPVIAAPAPPVAIDRRWHAVSALTLGASVELPGAPKEWHNIDAKPTGSMISQGLVLGDKDKAEPSYSLFRIDMPMKERAEDQAILRSYAKGEAKRMRTIEREEPLVVGGFRGLRIEGINSEGQSSASRVILVGRSFYVIGVEAPKERWNAEDAERYFSSFRLTLPWHVHELPEARCTIAVPDSALVSTPALDAGDVEVKLYLFHLGGEGALSYALAHSQAIPQGPSGPSDSIFDTVVANLEAKGNKVDKVTRISFEGANARELRVHGKDTGTLLRVRLLATGDRFYQLMIESKLPELLDDAAAQRFFGSFRPAGP